MFNRTGPTTFTDTRGKRAGGSAYVVVLGTAAIITVIGLSALLSTRMRVRSTRSEQDAARARVGSRSVMEIVMHRIVNDANWRSTYTHDTWTSDESLNGLSFRYKLVDDQDTDLADDTTESVRLLTRATFGQAVRLHSVLLTPPTNLLASPGLELGVSPWRGEGCSVALHTAVQHTGANCLEATGRSAATSGPIQDLTSALTAGTTYNISVWVRTGSGTDTARIALWVDGSASVGQWFVGGAAVVDDTGWTQLNATITPTWSGSLDRAWVKIETISGTMDLLVDDASILPDQPLLPVPGSWRREVE